jgi:hypothetical protein
MDNSTRNVVYIVLGFLEIGFIWFLVECLKSV